MKIGYKTLNWSASIFEEDGGFDEEKLQNNPNFFRKILNRLEEFVKPYEKILNPLMNLIAILFSISLFMYLPYFLTSYFIDNGQNALSFNIIAGIIRIFIFLTYLIYLMYFPNSWYNYRVLVGFKKNQQVVPKSAVGRSRRECV